MPTARKIASAASMLREYAASPRSGRCDSVRLRSAAICVATSTAETLGMSCPAAKREGCGASASMASATWAGDAVSFSSCASPFTAATFSSNARSVSAGREPQPKNMSSALGALDASKADMSSSSSEEQP